MHPRFTGLWRHPDFLRLWAGESISQLGSMVTLLALPLTAVLMLGATPAQMGLLAAAERAPALLVGLFAGVWVDRLRRRPTLIGADLGRAALLASIPAAALGGVLRIEQLYVVAFLLGALTVLFDVAYQAYLPTLVAREYLVEGNSKLQATASAAEVLGPGLGGVLVQAVTAPVALVLDAVSFLSSALFIGLIRKAEPGPTRSKQAPGVWGEVRDGLRVLLGDTLLIALTGCSMTRQFFGSFIAAAYLLYATSELGVAPAVVGGLIAVGGASSLAGALGAEPVGRRCGVGATIIGGALISGMGVWFLPLANGSPTEATGFLLAQQLVGDGAATVYIVSAVSLRQAIIPHSVQGRVGATMRFLVGGAFATGAVLGGALGQMIGLRPTLALAAAGEVLSTLWLFLSPVRTLREPPAPAQEPAPVVA